MIYSSHNGFRIKSEIKLSEYNCNQDLVSGKTENQIGFSIHEVLRKMVLSVKAFLSGNAHLVVGSSSFGMFTVDVLCPERSGCYQWK